MIQLKPQTIRSASGEEMVVLSRADYDALVRAAGDALEDAADIAIFDERMRELKAGNDVVLPAGVSKLMTKGDSLLRAVRRVKFVTQAVLAKRTGLAQGYISDLEAGRKSGTDEAWRKIARALDVPPVWFGVKDADG